MHQVGVKSSVDMMLPMSSTRQEEIMKEMIAIMEVTTGPLRVIHGKLLQRPEKTYQMTLT